MIWNKSKSKPQEDPPVPESVDVYVPFVLDWEKLYVCHCGHCSRYAPKPGHVCPKCGHEDSLVATVGRWVGERLTSESPSFTNYFYMGFDVPIGRDPNRRNVRFERWTTEHCEVKVD